MSGALARLVAALGIGAAGGGAAALFALPAAWMSGAMAAVGLAALLGLQAAVPAKLRDVVYVLIGVSMAAGVDPDLLARMAAWPVSLAGLAVAVAGMIAGSYVWLRRVCGWDPASAYFASIPGALSMTLIAAESSRADLRRVALSQTLRLFMLVAVLPLVVTAVETDAGGGAAVARVDGLGEIALLLAAGAAGAVAGHLLRLPAGILIGAFAASGILHVTGVVHGALPLALQSPALVVLGTQLGLRFARTDPAVLVRTISAGAGAFAAAFVASLAGAAVVSAVTGLGFGQTLIAYAPGGLDVMVILAFALKVDPAFVAAHHLTRFVAMTALVPVLARLVLGAGWTDPVPVPTDDSEAEAPEEGDIPAPRAVSAPAPGAAEELGR